MTPIPPPLSFADVVHQSIQFRPHRPAENLVLSLIDTAWFQRLRDISQTANTRLVYMFSEHSRFGHSIGVAYLAATVLERLREQHGEAVDRWASPVLAAALLHDLGHLAPGSHTAFKTWFPDRPDSHEDLGLRIIREDPEIRGILERASASMIGDVGAVLSESDAIPPWCWEIVSGSGWNVDRGNWCMVDSILAGVSYGRYNIAAVIDSLCITDDGHLAIRENRLDAMMHFAVSRHAMYRQIYQHRVLLAADTLNYAIAKRARHRGLSLRFIDPVMQRVLNAADPSELTLRDIFGMTECWWRYHLMQWCTDSDPILADLSSRLLSRRLFKTVRLGSESERATLKRRAEEICHSLEKDPTYYVHEITVANLNTGESENSLRVRFDNGTVRPIAEVDPLYRTLVSEGTGPKRWLAVPAEIKTALIAGL